MVRLDLTEKTVHRSGRTTRRRRRAGAVPAFDGVDAPDPRARRQVRALRLLPAVVSDLRVVGRGDGLAARTHLSDGGRPRPDARRCRTASCVTSTRVSAAWRASPPARRGCSTRRSSKRRAARSSGAIRGRSAIGCSGSAIFALFPYPARLAHRAGAAGRDWLGDQCRASRPPSTRDAERRDRTAGDGRQPRARVRDPTEKPDVRTEAPRGTPKRCSSCGPMGCSRGCARCSSSRRPMTLASLFAGVPARTPAAGARRLTVGLLTGCVQRLVFPRVNAATRQRARGRRLRRRGAGRAGMLRRARAACRPAGRSARLRAPHHRGVRARWRGTRRGQRRRLRILDERVRTPAGGRSCVGRARARLRRARARRQRDRLPSSTRRGRRGIRSRCASRITTPATSRTRRASGSRRAISCDRSPASSCCRSPIRTSAAAAPASTTSSNPSTARELGDRKAGFIDAAQPDVLATANPGCMLQMAAAARRKGRSWPIRHPIELLDASIRGIGVTPS